MFFKFVKLICSETKIRNLGFLIPKAQLENEYSPVTGGITVAWTYN